MPPPSFSMLGKYFANMTEVRFPSAATLKMGVGGHSTPRRKWPKRLGQPNQKYSLFSFRDTGWAVCTPCFCGFCICYPVRFLIQPVHGLCFLVARLPDSCLLASHLSGSYLSDPLPPGHLLPSGRRSPGRKQSGRSCCGVVVAGSQVSGSRASGSFSRNGPFCT